jgi:riboflavin kinase/FMN adenylyltransferase
VKLIRSYNNFPTAFTNSVLTIGNFDGVHKGHKKVIQRVKELAQLKDIRSLIMVFEPTAKEFFMGAKAPARLMRWRDRYMAIQKTGCDGLVQLKFNHALSTLSADDFVKEILVDAMNINYLVVGDDFRYGYQRSGNFQHLLECSKKFGFVVEDTQTLMQKSERVSSTAIRNALADGDIEYASDLLGYAYHMSGRVIHGNKLGRELGFPTMNIPIERQISPLHGIYAVHVHGLVKTPLQAIASIGTRPAVNGSEWLLEVHVLDYSDEHYGQRIDVEFLQFIRPELNFPNLEDLKTQMHKDLEQVRNFFSL